MIRNLFEGLSARFGSSGRPQGQFGYNVLDANGVDVTALLLKQKQDKDGYAWGRNRVVNQGLDQYLNSTLRGEGVVTTWYIAPFAANVTPAANLTAATFNSTMTEFVAYDESTRRTWTSDAASTAQELINAAAPALFTINASGSIWGAGLISASGKTATSGVLMAAAKRSTVLTVEDDFEVRIKYRMSMTSS